MHGGRGTLARLANLIERRGTHAQRAQTRGLGTLRVGGTPLVFLDHGRYNFMIGFYEKKACARANSQIDRSMMGFGMEFCVRQRKTRSREFLRMLEHAWILQGSQVVDTQLCGCDGWPERDFFSSRLIGLCCKGYLGRDCCMCTSRFRNQSRESWLNE